ncbi:MULTISPECIES: MerR family transcriptional regulator [unclassified Micromonospora]|uniref:MerR family transcriptional regulator n=1 Tax=unclassified Micromonospora TaxID=2617518 RepID=UPI001B37CD23|nr:MULTISPECIES: MerR family transcriptional regulator [unclassified Micromonospora]MBQ1043305.1 MerR family transcriptional regulator [Micromonospora sp. C72]MBQ1056473.1 MerR family transcriptional regulator [Micromonospora sp. C32]
MNGAERYSIGDLARRTGVPVKTIRFWSDRGIVPPTDRGPTGHRRYDGEAVARLDLVRTLRELGVDLPTVRRVVAREVTLPEVASAHADALAAQIRLLRSRRAALTVIARRGAGPRRADLLHRLAVLAARERRRLVEEFLDASFGDLTDPGFAGIRRSLTPELPDDPDDGQIEAWVELAELALDPGFRAVLRRLAEQHAADRVGAGGVRRDVVAVAREEVTPALADGVEPASPGADPVLARVASRYARLCGRPDDADLRRRMLDRLRTARDPRRERYLELLSVVNGWPPAESLAPVLDWSIRALLARQPLA